MGRRVLRTVYENDQIMFLCTTPEDAARVVGLLNRVEAAESRIIELESAIVNAHGRGLPANWVYDDPETTLDLFVAETATLRHELKAAEAEAERLRSTDLVDRALLAWQKETQNRYRWRPISEIHEDYGDCVLVNIADAGDLQIGHNLNLDFDISKWTHFTRFAPIGQEEYERMKAEVEAAQADAPDGGDK